MDPFSEKYIYMCKIVMVRFTEVNKHFWRLEAINYFVTYDHFRLKIQISGSA